MHRELLSNPHIGSYPAFLLLGLLSGALLARWRAVRVGIKGAHIDNLMLLVALLSLFGARLFSWWFYFPPGASLWEGLTSRGAGMVFYGGLIFGLATIVIYGHVAHLSLANVLDACAPAVALGLAMGRIGCFMAGCCWGDLCVSQKELTRLPAGKLAWQVRTVPAISYEGFPLAVEFPLDTGAHRQHQRLGLIEENALRSRPVHPVQLYEAVLAFLLFLALHFWFSKRKWPGQVVCGLLFGYACIRFATEFLRGDNQPAYAGLTLSQLISLIMAAGAIVIVLSQRSRTEAVTPAPATLEPLS